MPGTKGGPAALQVLLERSRSGSRAQELDGFFQFFGCSESDFLAGPNLNCLAGRRVSAHASSSFSNLQDAEPRNSDSFALLQMLGDQTDEVVQEFASWRFVNSCSSAKLAARGSVIVTLSAMLSP